MEIKGNMFYNYVRTQFLSRYLMVVNLSEMKMGSKSTIKYHHFESNHRTRSSTKRFVYFRKL